MTQSLTCFSNVGHRPGTWPPQGACWLRPSLPERSTAAWDSLLTWREVVAGGKDPLPHLAWGRGPLAMNGQPLCFTGCVSLEDLETAGPRGCGDHDLLLD